MFSPFTQSFKKKIFLFLFFALFFLAPQFVWAANLELFPKDFERTIALHATDPRIIVARIINAFLLLLGVITLVLILYGGFLWMTSGGNEEKISKAKKILLNAGIGLLLILSSFSIARFLISRLIESLGGAGGEVGYESSESSLGGYLSPDAFYLKGISPSGVNQAPRNVVVRLNFSQEPDPQTVNSENILIRRKDNQQVVEGDFSLSGKIISFVPKALCPPPNTNRHCFEADTQYEIIVQTSLKSKTGKNLSCGGLAPSCQASFTTGNIVDVEPPKVTINSPKDGEPFPLGGEVEIQVQASDDSGISLGELYVNQEKEAADFWSPSAPSPTSTIFSFSWSSPWDLPTPTSTFFRVKVFDLDDNSATSLPVKIWIRPAHCSNEKKDNDEEGVDCGGECGKCDGDLCTKNEECASGLCQAGKCVSQPKILSISPGGGKEGTFVTISGRGFGKEPGKVIFLGSTTTDVDDKIASPPAACGDPKNSWSNEEVLVAVPSGAQDGPIKICNTSGLCDQSDDDFGPKVPLNEGLGEGFFDVNDLAFPGLCRVYSQTPHTACEPQKTYEIEVKGEKTTVSADEFCQYENRDSKGNPDKSAYCHKEKKFCVFPKGLFNSQAFLEGVNFGEEKGLINWSGLNQIPLEWKNTEAQTTVPYLQYGKTKVQIIALGKCQDAKCQNFPSRACQKDTDCNLFSNPVTYEILSPDAFTSPEITSISPTSSGPNSVLKIEGKNFGQKPGIVWFKAPDGQIVAGSTNLNPFCLADNLWWQDDQIIIKVPEIKDINDYNKDGNRSDLLTGKMQIYVRRADLAESNKKDFEMNSNPPSPAIECLKPNAGPRFLNISLFGENFGSSPGFVFFEKDGQRATATLVNISEAPGAPCPSSGWSDKQICVQVPGDALNGANSVWLQATDKQGLNPTSNSLTFTVGLCNAPPTKDGNPNPEYITCQKGLECCGNGACLPTGQCKTLKTKQGAFGWTFTTAFGKSIPRVVEECLTNVSETKEAGNSFPSPSPWLNWSGGNQVCLNAQIAARFTVPVVTSTLNSENIIVEKCQGGVETENLLKNGDFEGELPEGPGVLQKDYLEATQVAAPSRLGDLPNDSQDLPGTNKALRLEKLKLIPPREIGESQPGAQDGNQFIDYFAFSLKPKVDNLANQSLRFSAKVKAAKTKDGNFNALGQKAGILLRAYKNNGSIETEKSQEIVLTENWQEISLTANLGSEAASLELRLYLLSPPASEKATDYHKYAAYFDDLRLVNLGQMPCQKPEKVSGDIQTLPSGQDSALGFSFLPQESFSPDTWYRVTLKTGIKGADIKDAEGNIIQEGGHMEEKSPLCGPGNAYCWLFKTGKEACQVKNVWVIPNPYTATYEYEKINYSALPIGKDACVALNPKGFNWNWQSSDETKARLIGGVSSGQVCTSNNDCPIGPPGVCSNDSEKTCQSDADCGENASCVQAPACQRSAQGQEMFCQAMPWTKTAEALDETSANQPALIQAKAQKENNQALGQSKLYISFAEPKVVNFWPACQKACLNASIGAEFNVSMQGPFDSETVRLYEITCGNGKIDPGEDCDDGNTLDDDGCSSQCLNEGSNYKFQCGNGQKERGEDCDDGNTLDGDGCSSKCLNEGVGPGAWEIKVKGVKGVCGNGELERFYLDQNDKDNFIGEECDDGNNKDGDGCSSKCLHEGTKSDLPICGNGRIEKGEECEKDAAGNFPSWCDQKTCLRKGTLPPTCGNGKIDPGEECDPKAPPISGDPNKKNLCASNCLWTGTLKPSSINGPGCGNKKVEIGEDCDDGNTSKGDGCSEICLNEGSLQTEVPVCGNGKIDYGEDCDDGNIFDGDGCSSKCLNEGASHASCGNGVKEKGEDCDWKVLAKTYGEKLAQMLCDPKTCLNSGGFNPNDKSDQAKIAEFQSQGKPYPICGNGKIEDGEDCDDKNTLNGDGCNSKCLNEGRGTKPLDLQDIIYDNSQHRLTFNPQSDLKPLTSYRVVLDGTKIKSSKGKPLSGLNYSISGKEKDAFSWVFKTKDSRCSIDRIEVLPSDASLYLIGAKQNYLSLSFSKPDECSATGQELNNLSYYWSWASSKPDVATISNYDLIPSCGDGIVEIGEDCDDGNTLDGDGCSSHCLNEGSNYQYQCGNKKIDPGEDCDPPDPLGLICQDNCLSGKMAAYSSSTGFSKCGDGQKEKGEECDDGNSEPGDGCSPICLNEGSSPPICGNGQIELGEECDIGWVNATTRWEKPGEWPPGCDQKTCLHTGTGHSVCGNGKIEKGEDCDDGNTLSGDGCSALCLNEGSSKNWGSTCGNGVKEKGEDCDDGNTLDGDGCSKDCLNEGRKPITEQISRGDNKVDPFQEAEALGLDSEDKKANRFFSTTKITASTSDEGQTFQGEGNLTVYCGMNSDSECATKTKTNIADVGRGGDSCCYPRPRLRAPYGTISNFCPNGLLVAQFNTLLDPNSLSGNFLLAKQYNTSTCPNGTTPINPQTGSLLSLVNNGSFEEGEGKDSKYPRGWEIFIKEGNKDWTKIEPSAVNLYAYLYISPGSRGFLGKSYLIMNASSPYTVKAIQKVNVQKGATYRVTAYYLVPYNVKGSARLSISFGQVGEFGYDIQGKPTNGWQAVYKVFTAPISGEATIELIAKPPIQINWDAVTLETLSGSSLSQKNSFLALLKNFFNQLKKVLLSWLGFSAQAAQSQVAVWCVGDITLNPTLQNVYITENGENKLVSNVILTPSKVLDLNSSYRVVVVGDSNLDDDRKEGVLSQNQVALNADPSRQGSLENHSWSINTLDRICLFDQVDIVSEIPSNSSDSRKPKATPQTLVTKDAQRSLEAYACSLIGSSNNTSGSPCSSLGGQPIQGIKGYDWDWSWNVSDDKIGQLNPKENQATTTLQAQGKNGDFFVTAGAKMKSDNTISPPSPGSTVSGSKKFTVFVCENPWPKEPDSEGEYLYKDKDYNFAFSYCRDGGLPAPEATTTLSEKRPSGRGELILKEILLPFGRDVIGIRVMSNSKWLSPMDWYQAQGFTGEPHNYPEEIDGYQAIEDGTTVYIGATNVDKNNNVYSNIYLISYNPDAPKEIKDIRNQIVKNFRLNTNLINSRVCQASTTIFCSADLDCLLAEASTTGNQKCLAPKDKLLRDLIRLNHINFLSQALENYHKIYGRYPDLGGGTYIRGMSVSPWSSWQKTLGQDLKASLPDDPLRERTNQWWEKQCGKEGYDSITCWNALNEEFFCPAFSQIYGYQAKGPGDYQLLVNFEYASKDKFKIEPTSTLEKINSDFCGGPLYTNKDGFCGDGVIQPQQEACEIGQKILVGREENNVRYWCEQECGKNCQWSTELKNCRPQEVCGNGVVEGGEVCDDGKLNGQYGKCRSDCQGLAEYCGDGKVNGPEKCDDGSENGLYGHCRLDCSGWIQCGNGTVEAPYEDCEIGQRQETSKICSPILDRFKSCSTDADCPPLITGNYPQLQQVKRECRLVSEVVPGAPDGSYYYRECRNDCRWDKWQGPVRRYECGNGIQEGKEECDDGQNYDDKNFNGIPDGDEDGCTNECKRPVCGDGKPQIVPVCVAPTSTKWKTCEKDSDCGPGGKCQATEDCDLGTQNGTSCSIPPCIYCSTSCRKVYRSAP